MASDLGRTNGDATTPSPETTPPSLHAQQHNWMLQNVMELQKSIGELVGAQKALTAAVEKQSDKIDAQRTELTAAIGAQRTELTAAIREQSDKIDAQRHELTSMIDKQADLVRTAQSGLDKLSGAIRFGKWALSIGIALATLALIRLPAIIDAIARALRGTE